MKKSKDIQAFIIQQRVFIFYKLLLFKDEKTKKTIQEKSTTEYCSELHKKNMANTEQIKNYLKNLKGEEFAIKAPQIMKYLNESLGRYN